MGKRVFLYGERMTIPQTFVRDEITAQPKNRDPKLEAKLARVVDCLEKLVAEDRPAATDVMAAKKAQRRENARRLRERNAKAKKYEDTEDRVTVPARFLEDAIRQAAFEAACEGSQAAAPGDSYVTPEPWAMPGYDSDVIMAAGAFVQGSSIELSADGPIKPPYAVYFQGGLTWYHAKLGILMSLQKLKERNLVNTDLLC